MKTHNILFRKVGIIDGNFVKEIYNGMCWTLTGIVIGLYPTGRTWTSRYSD